MKKLQAISCKTAAEVVASVGPSPNAAALTVAGGVAPQLIKQHNEARVIVDRIREWHREFALCNVCPTDQLYNDLTAQLTAKRKALKTATRELEDARDELAPNDVVKQHEATVSGAKRELQQTNAAIDRVVLDMSMMVIGFFVFQRALKIDNRPRHTIQSWCTDIRNWASIECWQWTVLSV